MKARIPSLVALGLCAGLTAVFGATLHGSPAQTAEEPEAHEVLAVMAEPRSSDDEIPAHIVATYYESLVPYDWSTSRLLWSSTEDAFYVVETTDRRVCLLGIAPRNDYEGAEPGSQTATTCKQNSLAGNFGLVLFIGPTQSQRGFMLVPRGFDDEVHFQRQGETTTRSVVRSGLALGPFDARDPAEGGPISGTADREAAVFATAAGARGRLEFSLPAGAVPR